MPNVINNVRHFLLYPPQYFMSFFSKIVRRITDFSPLMIVNRERIAALVRQYLQSHVSYPCGLKSVLRLN